MAREIDIRLSPEDAADEKQILIAAASSAGISPQSVHTTRIIRRSIDARKSKILINLRVEILEKGEATPPLWTPAYKNVTNAPEVLIAGAGPAGLFCALRLIEAGLKPVIIERGKDVRSRRRDLALINREHIVDPNSNYCFGEGGAGTYSDGKLYTRSGKRGDIKRILDVFVYHGASPEIMVDAHPHIGTNKLPKIITAMRETILQAGGEVLFNSTIVDLVIQSGKFKGVVLSGGSIKKGEKLVLATGHSARDVFNLLHNKGISIESKPFALGVRIEHPQAIIDKIQYKCEVRNPLLPPAAYSLVEQVEGKGVYSFCMCPGGIIAPCATSPGEIVTNGWSPSKRNNPFANSGMVVAIGREDFDPKNQNHPLAAMNFQAEVEKKAWILGGKTQTAPAQRMVDFVERKISSDLPPCSYQPGINSSELRHCLPPMVANRLAAAFKAFGKKMKGYYTNEAVLLATESRTSSPVRIPRDPDSYQHPMVEGLFPCGEGAGYAGGIVSAAMDGEKIAEKIAILHAAGTSLPK